MPRKRQWSDDEIESDCSNEQEEEDEGDEYESTSGEDEPAQYHRKKPSSASYNRKKPSASNYNKPKSQIYVLFNPKTKMFYVGRSSNVEQRIAQHREGTGSQCARGCTERVALITDGDGSESHERKETLALMHKHGIGQVRGGCTLRRMWTRNTPLGRYASCMTCADAVGTTITWRATALPRRGLRGRISD